MSELRQIPILPGVETTVDKPVATTQHFTFARKIRFKDGLPEKIGGWTSLQYSEGGFISGVARTVYSYLLNGLRRYVVGTNSHLYDVTGSEVTNITPLQTTTIAVANLLDNHYATLPNDPVYTFTTNTSRVFINDPLTIFELGDTVVISGVVGTVGGIPASEVNGTHIIREVSTNFIGINVDSIVTSEDQGGGASVIRASGIIRVNKLAHGLANGDRVKILNSSDVGGVLASEINIEHIIRNVDTDRFEVSTSGVATSAVTGGGGASAEYQEQIAEGLVSAGAGIGYGAGLYGAGLYGVAKVSTNLVPPRIWSHDRFGDLTVHCAGQQGDIYSWDASTSEAPAKILNSPPANYVFVTDSIVVALGYDLGLATAKGNAISWSDQAGLTNWTTGQAGSDTIEGAGDFVSHASVRGENLLFTKNQTYRFRYIGGQFIFQTRLLDPSVGIIAQNARCVVDGVVYWMSGNNFYMWRGANVEVIPSNSSKESTILNFVFANINKSQLDKVFCWYNSEFREVWWHFPTGTESEPIGVVRFNIDEFTWTPDTLINRTAGEYPSVISETPYLINSTGKIYKHEDGANDDGQALSWSLATRRIFSGTNLGQLKSFIPNYNLSGNINVILRTYSYPNSDTENFKAFTCDSSTERVPVEMNGRYWQYILSGEELDQTIQFGNWLEEVQEGSRR